MLRSFKCFSLVFLLTEFKLTNSCLLDAGTVQTDILVDVVPLPADHPTFIPFDQALNMIDHQSIIPIGQSIELSTTISQSSDLETSFSKLVSQSESTIQSFPSGSQSKSTDKSRKWGASVRPAFLKDFEQQQGYDPISLLTISITSKAFA